ncbi:MAG: TraR/DksA C4-type zinc finger protein [Pseudorhodobacter sp.]|nr:TraR/DksA C4-type zinc finger protein [Pseudorhodobacter sp.]
MTPISRRKAALEARLADLQARLTGIDDELDSHASPDWEELAAERAEDEVLEGMGLSGLQEIRMIEAALARIAAGEYGVCTKCGGKISEERLDVLPYTPFCRICAAESQKE